MAKTRMDRKLDEIRARLKARTSGNWTPDGFDSTLLPDGKPVTIRQGIAVYTDEAPEGVARIVAFTGIVNDKGPSKPDSKREFLQSVADAEFIAAAPDDIEFLLEQIERLEERASEAREEVSRLRHPDTTGQ